MNWTCFNCGKKGHIAELCYRKVKSNYYNNGVHQTAEQLNSLKLGKTFFDIKSLSVSTPPLYVTLRINSYDIKCEIDTGACMGVMSYILYRKYFTTLTLQSVENRDFSMADGTQCQIVGSIRVKVNNEFDLETIIIQSNKDFCPLVGRNWLDCLCPNWKMLLTNQIKCDKSVISVITR